VDSVVLSGARLSCYQAQILIVLLGANYRAIRRIKAEKIEEIQRILATVTV
jgi:hypothetical protein